MNKKVCSKCKIEKELTEFSKDKSRKDGHYPICKQCRKKYFSKYYKKNKERLMEYQENYRTENEERIKEYQKEYYKENRIERLEHQKEYYKENKNEVKRYKHKYYKNNKEKLKKINKEYYNSNRDEIREKQKKKRIDNIEEFKEKEKIYRYKYNHSENGRERKRILAHNRRAKVKGIENYGTHTEKQWEECKTFFRGLDAYNGSELKKATADHITPIDKGGKNYIYNIVPCSGNTNSSKGNKDLYQFYKDNKDFTLDNLLRILYWRELCKVRYYHRF